MSIDLQGGRGQKCDKHLAFTLRAMNTSLNTTQLPGALAGHDYIVCIPLPSCYSVCMHKIEVVTRPILMRHAPKMSLLMN